MTLVSSQIIPLRLTERLTLFVVKFVLNNTKKKKPKKNKSLFYTVLAFNLIEQGIKSLSVSAMCFNIV
jgi:hypothetical protein